MSRGDNWSTALAQIIKKEVRKSQMQPVRMAIVTKLKPLTLIYNEVEFSADRDFIYMNNLLIDENINLDVDGAMAETQTFDQINPPPLISTKPQTSSTYTGTISGTIPDFIKEFYNWFKAWHNRYILHVGDMVAIQKIGENKIIVLCKLQRILQAEDSEQ